LASFKEANFALHAKRLFLSKPPVSSLAAYARPFVAPHEELVLVSLLRLPVETRSRIGRFQSK
jgi:hypothetical protein